MVIVSITKPEVEKSIAHETKPVGEEGRRERKACKKKLQKHFPHFLHALALMW